MSSKKYIGNYKSHYIMHLDAKSLFIYLQFQTEWKEKKNVLCRKLEKTPLIQLHALRPFRKNGGYISRKSVPLEWWL